MENFKKMYYLLAAGVILNFLWAQIVLSQEQGILPNNPSVDVLEVKNADLFGVLDSIAVKSGLKIIVDSKIEGKVTIYLKDVNVYDVLRIVLEANGLAYHEFDINDFQNKDIMAAKRSEGKVVLGETLGNGDVVEIMTAQEFERKFGYSFGQKIQTRIIPLVYSKAEDIVKILDQIKSDSGKIFYNEQASTLVLMDAPDKLEAMTTVIKEWDMPLTTQRFNLQHAKAEEILSSVQEALKRTSGKVEMDIDTNALIVTDQPMRLKEIGDIIKALDMEDKQISIETKILKIILSDEHQEGIDWEAIVSNYQSLKINKSSSSPKTSKDQSLHQNFNVSVKEEDPQEDSQKLSLGTVSEEDYAVLLDALDTVGDIQIISNTKLSTLNNKSAELLVKTLGLEPPGKIQGGIPPVSEEVEFKITPLVKSDQTLALTINSCETLLTDKESENLCQVSINVQEGSTVVVGGLFKETMVELKEKIPLLGDIPILGLAFRHQGPRPRKAEIVVFLTPKLIIPTLSGRK